MEYVGEDTKIVWIGSPPIFPFKPRDFCTVIHIRKLKDGTVVVLNRLEGGNVIYCVQYTHIQVVYASIHLSFSFLYFIIYCT